MRFTLSTWTKSSRWYYTIQIARTFFFNMFFFVRRQHVFVNYEKAIRFVSSVCLASQDIFFFPVSFISRTTSRTHACYLSTFLFLTNRKCKGLVLQALLAALDRFVCTSLCFLFSFNRNNVSEVDRQRTGRLGEGANRDTLSRRGISPGSPSPHASPYRCAPVSLYLPQLRS